MVRSIAERLTDARKEKMGSIGRYGPLAKQRLVQEGIKGREHELKSPHILHATKYKHQPVRTIESNKHGGSGNGVKARNK